MILRQIHKKSEHAHFGSALEKNKRRHNAAQN
jgi:hypothetical protein